MVFFRCRETRNGLIKNLTVNLKVSKREIFPLRAHKILKHVFFSQKIEEYFLPGFCLRVTRSSRKDFLWRKHRGSDYL